MGKKRKTSVDSSNKFKMKIASDTDPSVVVTFPSGYVPGTRSETLHAFDHAEQKSDTLILTTVCDCYMIPMIVRSNALTILRF